MNVTEKQWNDAFDEAIADLEIKEGIPRELWRAAGKPTKGPKRPRGEDIIWWRTAGWDQVIDYIRWFDATGWKIATLGDRPALELGLEPVIVKPIKMFIDCVYETQDGLVVVDFKTGSRAVADPGQLGLYSFAIIQEYDVEVPHGGYYSTRKGMLGPRMLLTQYDYVYWNRRFAEFFWNLEQKRFQAQESFLCKACGVADKCALKDGKGADLWDVNAGAPHDYTLPRNGSYSQLTAYEKCPAQYALERLKKAPSVPGVYMAAGTAVHAMLEKINLQHWEQHHD